MKIISLATICGLLICSQSFAQKQCHKKHHHKIHAPIGVMRDHTHDKGEFMFSYRYSQMVMENLRNGDDSVSRTQALEDYPVTPEKMNMQMHMFSLMYGLSDKLTLSAMSSFIVKDMDHTKRDGTNFVRESEGIGDTKINAMYKFYENDKNDNAQFNLGISLPTADINESHNETRLPYPMQIGSGSYELLPGISSTLILDNGVRLGGQINAVFRMDSNKYGYKLGDSYNVTSWVDKRLDEHVSVSTRLDYNKTQAIEGRDSDLMPSMISTADSSLSESERLDILLGLNLSNGFSVEFGLPLYQRIGGPNLETKYRLIAGWQKSF